MAVRLVISQDKQILVNVDNIASLHICENAIYADTGQNESLEIGMYENNKIAIKVLEEITTGGELFNMPHSKNRTSLPDKVVEK